MNKVFFLLAAIASLVMTLIGCGGSGGGGTTGGGNLPPVNGHVTFVFLNEIYLAEAGGSNVVRLTNDNYSDSTPVLSPDGAFVFYCSNRGGNQQICSVATGGSHTQQLLTSDVAVSSLSPSISFDGAMVDFVRGSELWTMNIDGTNQHPLPSAVMGDCPARSPDGTRVAYVNNDAIWLANADGSNPIQLTASGWVNTQPRWSPDGAKIVFASDGGVLNHVKNIWIMNSDGSGPLQLTNSIEGDDSPSFCPNGEAIVFHSFRSGNGDMYAMWVNGSGQIPLKNNTTANNEQSPYSGG